MEALAALVILMTLPHQVRSCVTPLVAQSTSRSASWTSQPSLSYHNTGVLRTFLFTPPKGLLDEWTSADFALLNANLSLGDCWVNLKSDNINTAQLDVYIALLPEVWIKFLPFIAVEMRNGRRPPEGGNLCGVFSPEIRNQVPSCQDWSRLEAWKRLRIFYDITSPIVIRRTMSASCSNSSSRSVIDVTSMIQRWMSDRPPWIRSNVTLPVVVFSTRAFRNTAVTSELQLAYWMDGKRKPFLPHLRQK